MIELSNIITKIARLLADLPKAHHEAVEMALYQGISHSEIAERLGQPVGTGKSRIGSAVIEIRGEVRVR